MPSTYTNLLYHFVFSTKERRRFINENPTSTESGLRGRTLDLRELDAPYSNNKDCSRVQS